MRNPNKDQKRSVNSGGLCQYMRTRILAQVTSNKTQSVRRTRASKRKRKEKQKKIKETRDTQRKVCLFTSPYFFRVGGSIL